MNNNRRLCTTNYCRFRSQWPGGLRRRPWSLGRWDRGFKFRLRHVSLSSFCAVLSSVRRGLCNALIRPKESYRESKQITKPPAWRWQPYKDCRATDQWMNSRVWFWLLLTIPGYSLLPPATTVAPALLGRIILLSTLSCFQTPSVYVFPSLCETASRPINQLPKQQFCVFEYLGLYRQDAKTKYSKLNGKHSPTVAWSQCLPECNFVLLSSFPNTSIRTLLLYWFIIHLHILLCPAFWRRQMNINIVLCVYRQTVCLNFSTTLTPSLYLLHYLATPCKQNYKFVKKNLEI
jgi:hypothetical protein